MKYSEEKNKLKHKQEAKRNVDTLTKKQRELLTLVYRFRFVTAPLVAQYSGQKYLQTANERLNHLVILGYLAKRQDSSYHLLHRPVEYYATTHCIKLFYEMVDNVSERELKQIYVRARTSDRYVLRSTNHFLLYLTLRELFGSQLRYSTKPQLNIDDFNYFPQPLPDGFMTIKSTDKDMSNQHLFVEYFDDSVSIGIHSRQIRKYIQYEKKESWTITGLPLPAILIVCQSEQLVRIAQKRVRYICAAEYSEFMFIVTSLNKLSTDIFPAQFGENKTSVG